jgi:curved DNA-binding protein CbpA
VTHYEVLGVAPTASAAEIKRAYRQQAQRHHPDVGGGDDAMERLNRAWATLGDPVRRRAYDNVLGVGIARPSAPRPTSPAPPVIDLDNDDEEDFGPEPPPPESTKHDSSSFPPPCWRRRWPSSPYPSC